MNSYLSNNLDKDTILFINDVFPEYDAALAKLSRKLNRVLRRVVLIDAERKASGKYRAVKEGEGQYEEIIVDFSDNMALRNVIKTLEERLLIVSGISEPSQLYFKRVIPYVPYVNTPTESSLDFCTDKGRMRELLSSYDPRISPKAMVACDASHDTVQRANQELEFPLIVKPSNLAGSLLVNKVHNEEDLLRVLESSFASLEEIYSKHRGLGSKTMIIEEFVEGDLFSVDAYVDAYGRVYILPFMHFQNGAMVGMDGFQVYQSETYHNLSEEEERGGAIVAEKAIHALLLRSSVAHIELFKTDQGWKVIELGARAGGWRQEMYEVSYGIDHAFNELLVKIGLEPELPLGPIRTHSTVFRIHAPKAGTLESIEGIEEAKKLPGVHSIRANLKPGEKTLPSTQGGEELVDGFIVNTDHDQLERDLAAIRTSIRVNIK